MGTCVGQAGRSGRGVSVLSAGAASAGVAGVSVLAGAAADSPAAPLTGGVACAGAATGTAASTGCVCAPSASTVRRSSSATKSSRDTVSAPIPVEITFWICSPSSNSTCSFSIVSSADSTDTPELENMCSRQAEPALYAASTSFAVAAASTCMTISSREVSTCARLSRPACTAAFCRRAASACTLRFALACALACARSLSMFLNAFSFMACMPSSVIFTTPMVWSTSKSAGSCCSTPRTRTISTCPSRMVKVVSLPSRHRCAVTTRASSEEETPWSRRNCSQLARDMIRSERWR
mmetsp:Transcript_32804/g.82322  ORF Transcript_32804/g.82322 Transcript_32804/m.82322 type:complete len:294 (+) Transcript_32804:400-1281(+)